MHSSSFCSSVALMKKFKRKVNLDQLRVFHQTFSDLALAVTGALPGDLLEGGLSRNGRLEVIRIGHFPSRISLSSAVSWTSPPTTKGFSSRVLRHTRRSEPATFVLGISPHFSLPLIPALTILAGTLTLSTRRKSTDSQIQTTTVLFARVHLQNHLIVQVIFPIRVHQPDHLEELTLPVILVCAHPLPKTISKVIVFSQAPQLRTKAQSLPTTRCQQQCH